jgi:hypothetical protein
MRKKWFFIAPLAIVAMVAFAALGGEVVRLLWNWLLPALFGWRQITFWQAVGLLALCRILFGGVSGRGFRGPGRRRWEKMTPEEREKFRERMGSRCGHFEPPAASPTA